MATKFGNDSNNYITLVHRAPTRSTVSAAMTTSWVSKATTKFWVNPGNDIIAGGLGDDYVHGGTGLDLLLFYETGDIFINGCGFAQCQQSGTSRRWNRHNLQHRILFGLTSVMIPSSGILKLTKFSPLQVMTHCMAMVVTMDCTAAPATIHSPAATAPTFLVATMTTIPSSAATAAIRLMAVLASTIWKAEPMMIRSPAAVATICSTAVSVSTA